MLPGSRRHVAHLTHMMSRAPRASWRGQIARVDHESRQERKIVVTISASFGSIGGVIGKGVAESLRLPFIDRAIPAEIAHSIAVKVDTSSPAQAHEHAVGPIIAERASMAIPRYITESCFLAPYPDPPSRLADRCEGEDAFRLQIENAIRDMASTTGGVVRGRAGAVILRDWPGALHVRLDGPADARLRQASAMNGEDEFTVIAKLVEFDEAQAGYFKHFYGADPSDTRLYHMLIDTTAMDVETCINLIVLAARSRAA
jgi:cytidylate kinase